MTILREREAIVYVLGPICFKINYAIEDVRGIKHSQDFPVIYALLFVLHALSPIGFQARLLTLRSELRKLHMTYQREHP